MQLAWSNPFIYDGIYVKNLFNMISFRLSITVVTLVSVLFLSSCQDHMVSPPAQARYRISQYSFSQRRSSYTFNFVYNQSGKLAGYTTSGNVGQYTVTLSYNDKGQLISRDAKAINNPNASGSTTTYEYNAAGNLVTVNLFNATSSAQPYQLSQKATFDYDSNAPYPSKQVQFYYVNGGTTSIYNFDYTYQNGNVVRSVFTNTTNSSTPSSVSTYQFDDKPNPFYNLLGVPEGFEDYVYNRNNITSATRSLTYDNNGLLTRLVTNINSDPADQGVNTYSYEKY